MNNKPAGFFRIEDILEQLGKGFHGARMYIGNKKTEFRCLDHTGLPVTPKFNEQGFVEFEVGVVLYPNFGKKRIYFVIALDPSDTYTLFVVRGRKLSSEDNGIYNEMLKEFVEKTYDEIIKKDFGGFTPI
jgi:hypothetical protein